MTNSMVNWGIISTADINRKVIPGAHASDKVELVAVASRDQARADAYAKEWGIPRAYGSYEALLADPEIEAVYISLPNTMHCEWSIKALEAGKHVLCEKPLTRHPGRGDGGVGRRRAGGAAAQRGVHVPAQPADEAAPPTSSRTARSASCGSSARRSAYWLYDDHNIRLRTDLEGGALMDVGCYNVSGSRLLADEPERVWGEAWFGPSGTDWVFTGTMRFPGDVIATFDCGTAMIEPRRARGDRQRGLPLPRRPVALQPARDRAAAGRRRRADRDRAGRTPTGWSSRTSATRSAARRSCCSGARTRWARRASLEALHASAIDEPRPSRSCVRGPTPRRASGRRRCSPPPASSSRRPSARRSRSRTSGSAASRRRVCSSSSTSTPSASARRSSCSSRSQLCPEHRHPPFDDDPGKEETFRCRAGVGLARTSTATSEIVLRPGRPAHDPARHAATGSRRASRARSCRSSPRTAATSSTSSPTRESSAEPRVPAPAGSARRLRRARGRGPIGRGRSARRRRGPAARRPRREGR